MFIHNSDDVHKYAIDHFFIKLLKIYAQMQTITGIKEVQRRTEYMQNFLKQLSSEIDVHSCH